jgi:hypothetical protein
MQARLVSVLLVFLLAMPANLLTIEAEKPPCPGGVQSMAVYESRIGEVGLLLEDSNMQMWVPLRYETHSRVIFRYLQDGYAALKELFGDHDMSVKFSVEHYPEGSPYATGGTGALGGITYSYSNLVDNTPEWNQYGIPHVSGYFEEMAHNFRFDIGPGFGFYEALGMMIGGEVALRVAWNPHIQQLADDGYRAFAATTAYYLEHNTGEPGVTENIYLTRILAHVFKTQVIDLYGWDALTQTFSLIQEGYPLRMYNSAHSWGGFLGYLGNVTGKDMHSVFGSYGLPVLEWTGEPGFEFDGVEPLNSSNKYLFRIRIVDREGSQPSDAKVYLYHDAFAPAGVSHALGLVGGNASSGWTFEKEVDISDPNGWKYAFGAKDGVHLVFQAVGEPTEKQPVCEARGTLLSLRAVPSNASLGENITLLGEIWETEPKLNMVWRIGVADGSSDEFEQDPHGEPSTIVFNVNESCSKFPSGLGTDIGPQRSRIVIVFDSPRIEEAIVHLVWNPGGSDAVEQFSVSLDGELLGTSSAIKGSDHPYEWLTDEFLKRDLSLGGHNVTFQRIKGDGLLFDFLRLDSSERTGAGAQVIHLDCNASGEWKEVDAVSSLDNGTYAFVWRPESAGTYCIRARCEGNTTYDGSVSENMTVHVFGEGDINSDGTVDMRDVSYVARRFMCLPSDPLWDSITDINSDGKIDMKDISTVARHFGEHYP